MARPSASVRRMHRNVLAVALANKLARIAWSVLAGERRYETRHVTPEHRHSSADVCFRADYVCLYEALAVKVVLVCVA